MGLWDWIVETFLTDPTAGPREHPPRKAPQATAVEDSSVAVLERPESPDDPPPDDAVAPWWAPEGATLVEPPTGRPSELSGEVRMLENMLVSHFDGHDLTLPPLLHVAERVLPMLNDPNCSLPETAAALSEDQVMAASILRMVNSPIYRGVNKITALPAAVTRLGLKAIRTLLMHESLRSATFHRSGERDEFALILWQRSLAGATIMRGLSEFTTVDKEVAFLIGLLHDIGNVIVLRIVHGYSLPMRYEIDTDTFEYLCGESHQEFGELIADSWGLPPNLKSLLADHHRHPASDDPLRTERLQLQLSDMICSLIGYAPYEPYDLLSCRVVQDLGLGDNPRFLAFLERLPGEVDETIGAL